ncbi:MAG: hypothetical protein AB7S49_00725 [Arcobacter sp.]|uniref:hypothetical protein n=1 Tax=Arcobacter sp. TaxID=1872629 RepID=UPI003CFC92AA
MHLTIIGIVIIITILLLIILIYLLMNNENSTNPTNKKEMVQSIKIVKLEEIKFPKNVEKMNINALSKACRVILDSYRALDYVSKLPSAMDKIEWHTWQVSILLHFLKTDGKLTVSNSDNFFHITILELRDELRKQDMQRILNKYLNNANIEKDRDTLSRDVIWTARDVSIILYEILKDR